MHTETNFTIIDGAGFDYDIILTDDDIKRILGELSYNKAILIFQKHEDDLRMQQIK